jgi:glycopeptide antibiotics resistance protein
MLQLIVMLVAVLGWVVVAYQVYSFPFRPLHLASLVFAGYLILLLGLTITPNPAYPYETPPAQLALIPFQGALRVLADPQRGRVIALAIDVVGNLLLFLPFGFLAHVRLGRAMLAAGIMSATIEACQFGLSTAWAWNRTTSVTDVLLNVASAGLGYWLAGLLGARTT